MFVETLFMFKVYDINERFVGRVVDWEFAKHMGDHYSGYVTEHDPWMDEWVLAYESWDYQMNVFALEFYI